MDIPDEVGEALADAFRKEDLGGANLSTVDSAANRCVMRVLSRRGLGPYKYTFVWPVLKVEVSSRDSGPRLFTFDIRDLVTAPG